MNTSISEYLEAYAATTGCTSDYAIAKKLGISKQAVSKYRRGLNAPGIDTCWLIADAIGAEPTAVIAAAQVQSAMCSHDPKRAQLWRARLSALSAHGEKVFSVLAALPLVVWSVPYCILCQMAQLPENQSDITRPSLRPKNNSVLSCA